MNKIFIVLTLQFFTYVLFNFINPIIPGLFLAKDVDSSMFGLSYALMSLGIFLASPFWGRMITSHQRGKIVFFSLAGYGFSQLIFGLSFNPIVMMTARLFAGLFVSAWMITSTTYVVDLSDDNNRLKYLSRMATVIFFGNAFGMIIAGYLGEISLYIPVIMQFFLLLIVGFLAYKFLPSNAVKPKNDIKPKITYNSQITFFMLLMFFGAIASVMFYNGINFYFTDVYNVTSSFIGNLQFSYGVASILILLVILPVISKKISPMKILFGSIVISIVLAAMFLQFQTRNAAWIISLLLATQTCMFASLIRTEATIAKTNVDTSLLMASLQRYSSLAMIFGALLAGFVYDYNYNYPAVLALAAFIILMIIILIFKLFINKAKEEPIEVHLEHAFDNEVIIAD